MSSPRPIRAVRGRNPIHNLSAAGSPTSFNTSATLQNSNLSSDDEGDSQDESPGKFPDASMTKKTGKRTQSPSPPFRNEKSFIADEMEEGIHSPQRADRSITFNRSSIVASGGGSPRARSARKSQANELKQKSPSPPKRRRSQVQREAYQSSPKPRAINFDILLFATVIFFLAAIFGLVIRRYVEEPNVSEHKYCENFESLKKTFPNQNEYIWRALKTGVEGVLNNHPPKPSVFLFLHRDDNSAGRIITKIVDTAAACFNPTLKAVTLDSDEFSSEDAQGDYGVIIKRYKEALRNGGVVLIADLNKIPSQTARALHFICDNENPMINNVVIFLTLTPLTDVGKPVEMAEDTLNLIWNSTIDQNTLSALVTRVTDQVISLHPE
ncbi:unnamed protein product [Hermetia illucens]|uniref:Torsin-1A-interacting protein 1/2 AAA+ activator domain-containing protein n=1 Tax=Hermetia illucens TaxID=343691 RepID=A0A7R8YTD0_HERIL|nr:uncharacterized protein LOC119650103 [Hermetia illucens]CAD7081554.1 unnamed protein product [Hermetia illucens]